MKIHAFVVSWKGQHANAARIAQALEKSVESVTLVFSDPDPAVQPLASCQLVRTDDALFWGDKFSTCLQQVDMTAAGTDVMLVIHADCSSDDWPLMVARCRQNMLDFPSIGLWSPLVDGAGISLSLTEAMPSNDSLSLVSYVDGLVFAITRPVIQRLKKYDYRQNKFGWGIDWAICAFVFTHNLLAVVDRSSRVTHPTSRGYDSTEAHSHMALFIRQMTAQEKVYYVMASSHVKLKRLDRLKRG
jgi:hypothetical protein